MTLVYRTDGDWGLGKGGPLSLEEYDGNIWHLVQALQELVDNPLEPVQIASMTTVGTGLVVTMSDGSTFGPITLPTAVFVPPTPVPVSAATVSLNLGHASKMLLALNATGTELTIPAHADVAFPIGTEIDVVQEDGAGPVTVTTADVVTLRKRADRAAATDTVGAVFTLKKIGTNIWRIFGDLAVTP